MNRIQTGVGKGGRVIAARLLPGSDFMGGIADVCKKHNLDGAVLLSAIGSFKRTVYVDPIEIPEMKAGYGYGEPMIAEGPIELLSAAGLICHSEDGEVMLHVHANMCHADGDAFGGHLLDEGTEVLLTADIILQEIEGVDMVRRPCDETGMVMFAPGSGRDG